MTLRSWTLGLGLALLLAASGGARAWAEEPPAAPADDAKERKAKELYEQGNTHYDLAEYDQAIELFKQAYALSRRPTLLYNIAQAYRLKGDCEQALQVYKNYLRVDPSSQFRAKVESRIAEMETCVKDPSRKPVGKEAIQEDQVASAPRPVPEVVPPPTATERGSRGGTKKMIGLITGGVGVAAIGTGVFFSLEASSKADDVAAACPTSAPCDWNPQLESLQADGEAAERNAIILYAVGGVAVAGGVVLYLLGASEAAEATQVSVMPTRGGATFAASWTF